MNCKRCGNDSDNKELCLRCYKEKYNLTSNLIGVEIENKLKGKGKIISAIVSSFICDYFLL